jgi:glycosyltransferase involved in cell wall biosynthesis
MATLGPTRLPSVSVVVPTHERPQLLERAVRSVVDQDYRGDIECIVVFDRAAPSPVPVQTGPGRSIRVLANERTPGLAGARNTGALTASGELLSFLDDDDEWLPRKLSRQVDLMSGTAAHLVACGLYICRDRREIRRRAQPRITYQDLLRSRHMEANACTILVERSRFLNDIGPVDEEIPGSYAEDYEWLLRAARKGDILAIEEPLARISWHGSSYFARDWATIAAAQRYLLAKHPDFARQPAGLARISGQISLALAASGHRATSRRWARRAVRLNPRQPRPYLAMLASAGLVSADTMLRMANLFGRGL